MKLVLNKVKNRINSFRRITFDSFLDRKSFASWGLLIVFLNFVMLHALGFSSDLGYWRSWISNLEMGVGNFSGDYPPFYILWLRVVAAFYKATGLSLQLDYELKQFCLLPVILAHVSLAHFVWLRLRSRDWPPQIKTVVMLLVAINPAFYLDGPVWGQVDILPVTICVWALWYAARPNTFAIGMALFMLGLLTKFQMIMFLPVFGALALRYRKIMWKGLFAAGAVFVLVFLPFILTGNFAKEFSQAYLSSVGQYPYAAMNAGNLWMALVGNMTPDTRPIFEWAPAFMNPGLMGKILFVIVSFAVLLVTFFRRLDMGAIMMVATLNALAFFMLLPCMHERYCLAAAVMCVAAVSCQRKPNINGAVILSAVAYLNISMLMSTRGDALWFWISIAGIFAMVYFLAQNIAPEKFERLCGLFKKIPLPGLVPYVLLLLVYGVDMGSTFAQMARSAYSLKDGEVFVYDLNLIHQEQGYGNTHIGKSIDGNPLRVNGELYVAGIGTHAPSRHVYELPKNATRFTVTCGVDDESGNGVVDFIVLLDNREIWRSGRMEGRQVKSADLDIRGGRRISLVTDEMGAKNFDHADWVNPVVYTEK
ncbi:NPCBM/NEW2 domain-containing protein [Fibrobacter sp. UWH5]|uniref:NPCBM/NEW2 domain-containing protein n=1 Tax=Fibrobacter sp. UWH5 TaxID=1896211 RepID=UPI00091ABD46|nr:NPCBM/NEW2 domain-containing protein [Fibrobacter sp. UWH5]SHK98012.1 NPCBM/NEW2 domain-containing protein [Fibrobacter sp. UWH5]